MWYSRAHIEGLLDEMDHANADGLRIYFGAYGSDHESYSNQLCLLMVVTQLNSQTGSHVDICIEDAEDFPDRSTYDRAIGDFTKRDFNVGSPCPPICNNQGLMYPNNNV